MQITAKKKKECSVLFLFWGQPWPININIHFDLYKYQESPHFLCIYQYVSWDPTLESKDAKLLYIYTYILIIHNSFIYYLAYDIIIYNLDITYIWILCIQSRNNLFSDPFNIPNMQKWDKQTFGNHFHEKGAMKTTLRLLLCCQCSSWAPHLTRKHSHRIGCKEHSVYFNRAKFSFWLRHFCEPLFPHL